VARRCSAPTKPNCDSLAGTPPFKCIPSPPLCSDGQVKSREFGWPLPRVGWRDSAFGGLGFEHFAEGAEVDGVPRGAVFGVFLGGFQDFGDVAEGRFVDDNA